MGRCGCREPRFLQAGNTWAQVPTLPFVLCVILSYGIVLSSFFFPELNFFEPYAKNNKKNLPKHRLEDNEGPVNWSVLWGL